MPIYEYRCEDHGHSFEEIQKVSDPPLQTCRVCQGPVNKLVSRTSFKLTGNGFYSTDYSSKKDAPETKPAKKSASCGNGCGGH